MAYNKPPRFYRPILPLNFHEHEVGNYYQLIQVGGFIRAPSASEQDVHQVITYFLPVNQDGERLDGATVLTCSLSVHEAGLLKVGSIWDGSTGKLVITSRQAIQEERILTIGHKALPNFKLSSLFPDFHQSDVFPELTHFLSAQVLNSCGDMPIAVHEQVGQPIILIPPFELLRCLLFWAGKKMVNRYFSPQHYTHEPLFQRITSPTKENKWKAEIVLMGKGYSAPQAGILGALAYDSTLNKAITKSRSALYANWGNQNHWDREQPKAYVGLDFELDQQKRQRHLVATANGLYFLYNGKQYFWVFSIHNWQPFYAYDSIRYVSAIDNRAAIALTEDESVEKLAMGEKTHPLSKNSSVTDSSKAGLQTDEPETLIWDIGDNFLLPKIVQDPKLWDKASTRAEFKHSTRHVDVLSQNSGGDDLAIGYITASSETISFSATELNYFDIFCRVLILLQENAYIITSLSLNMPVGLDNMFSRYKQKPGKVGFAHIYDSDHQFHFYYVDPLSGQRAALLYAKDLHKISEETLCDIIYALGERGGSWHLVKQKDFSDLQKKVGQDLKIHRRNHLPPTSEEEKAEYQREMQALEQNSSSEDSVEYNKKVLKKEEEQTVAAEQVAKCCIKDIEKAISQALKDRQLSKEA